MKSESEGKEWLILVGDQTFLYSYGMHFCPTCSNLMKPFQSNGPQLDFICDKCKTKHPVDYSKKTGEDTLLYSKELQVGSLINT